MSDGMGHVVDITGKIYGRLTVLSRSGTNSNGRALWQCKCQCGKTVDINGRNLRSGVTKSCGCIKTESNANPKELVGHVFGRLTVLNMSHIGKGGNSIWKCRCECGKTRNVWRSSLKSGNTVSCGCFLKDKLIKRNTKHNNSCRGNVEGLYRIWQGIHERCHRTNRSKDYRNYRGRGITVCDEWSDYEIFRRWAFENGYKKGLQIDRENNNKGYSPDNCRWITNKVNNRNKRYHRLLTHNNQTLCVAEWAEKLGIKPHTLYRRMNNGWADEKVITTPVRGKKNG
jgi:hypothetical protein